MPPEIFLGIVISMWSFIICGYLIDIRKELEKKLMTPHNDGQGAMDLIVQLEGKVRKYKKERDDWMYISTIKSLMFNMGVGVGGLVVSVVWIIVLKSLGKI